MLELHFRTIGLNGTPLRDVACSWSPQIGPVHPEPPSEILTAKSDASGIVTIRGPCAAGRASFTKPGFVRSTLLLNGASRGVIDVMLEVDAVAGRTLRFLSRTSGMPVHDVELKSRAREPIVRAVAGSDIVIVPAWVGADEDLRVESPTTHPSRLRLRDVLTDDVYLPESREIAVVARGQGECDARATLWIRHVASKAGGPARAVLPEPVLVTTDVPATVEVPVGSDIELVAADTCGARAVARLGPTDGGEVVELRLRRSPKLHLSVRDVAGRPIPSAVIFAVGDGESTRAFRCDPLGRASVPLAPSTDSVVVEAPQHASSVATRNAAPSSSDNVADDQLVVTLERGVDVPIKCRSNDGAPVPGLLVRVWPTAMPTTTADSGNWRVGNGSQAVIGNTDDHGDFLARGVPLGDVDVEVDLDFVFGAGDAYQTLYEVPRTSFTIEDARERTIVVPVPRVVSIAVFDAGSKKPVSAFELAVDDATGRTALNIPGSYWRGWISTATETLTISVDGLGMTQLDAQRLSDGETARVELQPSAQVRFRVERLPPSIDVVRLSVMRKTPEGLHNVREAVAKLDDGRGSIVLESTRDIVLGIQPITLDGATQRFEPEFQPVTTDVELVFRCNH